MKKFLVLLLALMMCVAMVACGNTDKNTDPAASITPTNLSFKDSAEAYKNGTVDAFFCVAGEPTTAITELATTNEFNLVSLDDEHIDQLIEQYAFYTKYVIPGGTYSAFAEDATTVAIKATLIVSNNVDVDTVYELTKALFESKDEYTHEKANYIDMQYALEGLGGVAVHPGAAKYYEECGFTAEEYGYTVAEISADATAPDTIRFTTGGDSGTYYAFGGILANIISTKIDATVVAQTSGGSKANIYALEDNEAEIGWVQNDVMYYAATGTDMFEGEVCDGFSVIGAIYPEVCQIVGTKDIASVGDLAGKVVSIGDAGSGVEFNARQILSVYGIEVAE